MSNHIENKEIAFHCTHKGMGCGARFKTFNYSAEPFPERAWLPFRFVADCHKCGGEVDQAAWQLNLWKSYYDNGGAGPQSDEAKLKVSEGNKARDAASYNVSRFNAVVTGDNCAKATLFPARPGRYDQCEGCEFYDNGCGTEMRFCQKRNEIFLKIAGAMQSGDPSKMSDLFVGLQTGFIGIAMDMMRSIDKRGVEVVTPLTYIDKESGKVKVVKYTDDNGIHRTVNKVEVNPLIPVFSSMITKNKIDLNSLGLTPERKEEDAQFGGNLDAENERETLEQAALINQGQMSALLTLIGGDDPIEGVVVDVSSRSLENE